ncbi:DUF6210 family protein [Deinococcus oregonensis]|uniref:DUF6210 family protein n=1 Tax=Deinococcus oregonensis TaxID=1805970 RepID=A0ABV6ATW3_9DEIO
MDELAHVFLNPAGNQGTGVVVVIQAPTGVLYAAQVAGHGNEERVVEGFALPIFNADYLQALKRFFGRYNGNLPSHLPPYEWWEGSDLQELAEIVSCIPLWSTSRNEDQPAFLEFDQLRLEELTEGWIPVRTVYGAGILIHQNSD